MSCVPSPRLDVTASAASLNVKALPVGKGRDITVGNLGGGENGGPIPDGACFLRYCRARTVVSHAEITSPRRRSNQVTCTNTSALCAWALRLDATTGGVLNLTRVELSIRCAQPFVCIRCGAANPPQSY